ncbi:hypothetical protein GUITHDRAFT_166141 [Guillardia theta CCMP2712]|uniref:Uncharacterized protein n=1 Tax=Guillardia theta (strain CCMP2712) TaxID=905079 RepID=L1IFM1_GUITC|nr:hypothetical protein GUITHDRAFT_166141 [Guillardia theta CCMP2712]EKX34709.1 hypothetical protein GUITHDRAFT_166141 [Guillardia theta CCMP2712]|eukprot:XP_005821689.1 hypothetical protein GUITHDRAFT_166141 [Guillardia theta CCMP2712]
MHRRFLLLSSAALASGFITSPLSSLSSSSPTRLANHACKPALRPSLTSLRMVDWDWDKKSEEEEYDGAGADRGQINRSDQIKSRVEQRLAEAKKIAEEKGIAARSGLDTSGRLKEGDRDPRSGRVIVDPLKIPTSDMGAPGSWEEYMAMRKKKEGVVKDAFGNVIEDVKPSYSVQAGTWGPPKESAKDVAADVFSSGGGKVMGGPIESDAEQEEWRRQRDEEEKKRQEEVEARMQMWLKQAADKKAQGGN